MANTDPRVDAYITKSAPFAQPILQHIRKAVHAGCPDVEETIKWSFPHFVYKGMLCSMASFKAHCAFGFWKGSLLKDELGDSKAKDAMGQFGRIASLDDLPPARQLIALVRKAAALNEQGVKVVRRKSIVKAAPVVPAEFRKILRADKKALAAFTALSASHQREYLEWFAEAKTPETRQRRMGTALEWLSEGKARNWKYERQR
jgi:uncharacterized protein YdeI (YjbR/CyaY-like superfamily)